MSKKPQPPPLNHEPNEEQDSSLLYGDAEDQVIAGHTYDGIKEYDNPMPGWWVWMFVATIIVSGIYVLGIHVFDFIDTYEEDLAESQYELELIRESYAAANPSFEADEATLAAVAADPAAAEAGATHYAAVCAACHGAEGQGLIGPNLADAYWLHGGDDVSVFEVISVGVPAKGMPAWEGSLTPEERAQVLAYIRSFEGTEPVGAKPPQGDLYEPAS